LQRLSARGRSARLPGPPASPSGPEGIYQDECPSQQWIRTDPNFYFAQVGVGLYGGEFLELLAFFGTISP